MNVLLRFPKKYGSFIDPSVLHPCAGHNLEKALDTPARIYYKYEGNNPSGSHKLNTAIPQAYYNHKAGIKRLATETGAGQWGTALSVATQLFGMDCTVYMVKVSAMQSHTGNLLWKLMVPTFCQSK